MQTGNPDAVRLWPAQPKRPLAKAPIELERDGVKYDAILISSDIAGDDQSPWNDPRFPHANREQPIWDEVMRAHMVPGQPAPTWKIVLDGKGDAAKQGAELVGVSLYEWGKAVPVLQLGKAELEGKASAQQYAGGHMRAWISLPGTLDLATTYYAIVDLRIDGVASQVQTKRMQLSFSCAGPWGNEFIKRPTPDSAVGGAAPPPFGES